MEGDLNNRLQKSAILLHVLSRRFLDNRRVGENKIGDIQDHLQIYDVKIWY